MTKRLAWVLAPLLVSNGLLAAAKLDVVATTSEYAALARAIGGDRVRVQALAKPSEDPHFVDAKPTHLVTLNRADVLIEGGADLEIGWLPPLLEGARNPRIAVGAPGRIRASEGIVLKDVPAVLDRSRGDIHAVGNPHFMMDPENARTVARNIAGAFCHLDPEGCSFYRQRLGEFEKALASKLERWTARLAPFRGTPIVTYHNTWRYFADRFGLRADTFLEPKPGIPPSPPHLRQVVEKMKSEGVRAILVEPFQNRRNADWVAQNTGARVVEVCQFPGGLPGTEGDYLALMDANVDAIATALEAAPAAGSR
jgi:ABC-type Zn uptake system ZnuABC Zn-binding protein ZnuA